MFVVMIVIIVENVLTDFQAFLVIFVSEQFALELAFVLESKKFARGFDFGAAILAEIIVEGGVNG